LAFDFKAGALVLYGPTLREVVICFVFVFIRSRIDRNLRLCFSELACGEVNLSYLVAPWLNKLKLANKIKLPNA